MEDTVGYWMRRTMEKHKDFQGYSDILPQKELNTWTIMHDLIGEAVSLKQAGLAVCGMLAVSCPNEFKDLHYLGLNEDVLISYQGLEDIYDERIVEAIKSGTAYKQKAAEDETDVYIPLVGKPEIKGQIKYPKNDACVIGSLKVVLDPDADSLYFEEVAARAGYRLHQGHMLRAQKRMNKLMSEAQERMLHDGRNMTISMAVYLKRAFIRVPKEMQEVRELIKGGMMKCQDLEDFLTLEACKISQMPTEAMEKDTVNLSDILEKVLRFYESDIEQYGIAVKKSAVKGALTFGNETQLRSVVANLVDNAIKHGDKKVIEVSIEDTDKKHRISVMNSGKGIKESDRAGIFQDYVKDESSEGLGLGLGNVANIVKMHHGKIEVDSDGRTYTRFVVTLDKL